MSHGGQAETSIPVEDGANFVQPDVHSDKRNPNPGKDIHGRSLPQPQGEGRMSHGGQTKTSLPVEEILAARKDPNYKRKSKPAASKAMNLAWLSLWWMRMEREGQADQKQKRDTQPIRQFMVDTNNEKRKKRKAQHHLCTPTSKKGTEESYAQPPHTTPESGKDDMAISNTIQTKVRFQTSY
jgi:hypothetical protein